MWWDSGPVKSARAVLDPTRLAKESRPEDMPERSAMAVTDQRGAFALEVVETLAGAGFEAVWAGGCVRDLLLERTPEDYDIVRL